MRKSAKDNKILKICMVMLTAGCIVFILSNSLKPASVSGSSSQNIVDMINSFFKSLNIDFALTNFFLRKAAHFSEFCLLGIITSSTVNGSFRSTTHPPSAVTHNIHASNIHIIFFTFLASFVWYFEYILYFFLW